MATKKKTKTKKKKTRTTSASLAKDITRRNAWGDVTDVAFQEYVAREHIDDGMPVVELHRDHGIPLSAVKRWIARYVEAGRAGLEADAATAKERTRTRDAKLSAKGAKPEELAALEEAIASGDLAAKRAAYAIVRKRKLRALVPVIVDRIRATRPGTSVQDELELLAAIRAKEALHELVTAKPRPAILAGYRTWWARLLRDAGCRIRTVEKPWSVSYELGDKWYRLP